MFKDFCYSIKNEELHKKKNMKITQKEIKTFQILEEILNIK